MGSGASRGLRGGGGDTMTISRGGDVGGGMLKIANVAPSSLVNSKMEALPQSVHVVELDAATFDAAPFIPSMEFPTATLLAGEQARYAAKRIGYKTTVDASGLPAPRPHVVDRDRLFAGRQVEELDFHSASTPSSYELISDVLPHLFSVCSTSAEKVRAIFMWVANLAPPEDSGEDVAGGVGISSRRSATVRQYLRGSGSDGGREQLNFLELFRATCREAGFECRTVNGFAKGASFRGDYELSAKSNHAWSAVLVDGLWYLCDVAWSRRPSDPGAGGSGGQPASSFYFMTRPEEFIFSHFPDEQRWQLLARPVSRQEFCSMAYARKSLFTSGIRILNQHRFEIPCTGETRLQFSYQSDLAFRARMYSLDAGVSPAPTPSSSQTHQHARHAGTSSASAQLPQPAPRAPASMDGYVTTEAYAGSLSVRVEPPHAGRYRVELCCQGERDLRPALFVAYLIRCAAVARDRVLENPPNARHIWGPGSDTQVAGFEPATHSGGTVHCRGGAVEIVLHAVGASALAAVAQLASGSGGPARRPPLRAELRPGLDVGSSPASLDGYTLLHVRKRTQLVINARLPAPGKYALAVCVLRRDGASYDDVCTYLLVAAGAAEVHLELAPYPPVGCLGVTDYGKGVVRPVSHKSFYFEADRSGTEVMEFELKEPDETGRLQAELTLHAAGRDLQELHDYTLMSVSNDYWLEVIVRFPYFGTYVLELKEDDGADEGGPSTLVSYIIEVPLPAHEFQPFPTLTSFWQPRYQLHSPTGCWLLENSAAHFMLSVDDADELLIVVGRKQTALHYESSKWIGSVNAGPAGGLVQLLKKKALGADADTDRTSSATENSGSDGGTNRKAAATVTSALTPLATFKVLSVADMKERQAAANREMERAAAHWRRLLSSERSDVVDSALRERAAKLQRSEALLAQRRLVVEKTVEKINLERERREQETREMHAAERARNDRETREKIAQAKMSLEEVISALKVIEQNEALKKQKLHQKDADEQSLRSESKLEMPKVIYKSRRDSQPHVMLSPDSLVQLHSLVSESCIDHSVEKRKDELRETRKAERVARAAELRRRFRRAADMIVYQKRVSQRSVALLKCSAQSARARISRTLERERLRLAICSRNKTQIFDGMKQFLQQNAQGVSDALFAKAQAMIKILNRREVLVEAMRSRSADQLQRALANASDAEFNDEFPAEKIAAETLLKSLRRRSAVETALKKLDNVALLEVVNFSKPPKMVHSAIAAAFILSGTPSIATREWSYCRDHLKNVGMKSFIEKMCGLDVATISFASASEVNIMLSKTNLVHVAELSMAAAYIHAWSLDISINALASTEDELER